MRAWARLGDERPYTVSGRAAPMGVMVLRSRPGRIPWSAVVRWCEWNRLTRADAAFLEACIGILDSEYLAWFAEQEGK